ncbi:MAG: 3-phosphoshikimate 1-carboxyvinyltransferase [Ktedonobacterales bacterium]|nr:3-phosphoshikimate 1-carboxyvinyltransferase [Ktedonobacterales bacterium]
MEPFSTMALPERVTIHPGAALTGAPHLPGAKYPAVRALLLAALGDGPSRVAGLPPSDDTRVALEALARLGVPLRWLDAETLLVTGGAGHWPAATIGHPVTLDVGNAGAVMRLLLGVCAMVPTIHFTTSHMASLGQRPNADLLQALSQLGVAVEARQPGGLLPITLHGGGIHGGLVRISGARSSQYLSALLLLGPLLGEACEIAVTDEVRSAGFVRLTLAMLSSVGITVAHGPDLRHFRIASPQAYQAHDWQLPRDFPTAATWLAAGAVAGGTLHLAGLPAETEDGGAILAALHAFGADVSVTPGAETGQIAVEIRGGTTLRGAEIDGEPCIDSVPVLAALACSAVGTTTFRNVGNLRLKESNRIDDLCAELCRAGADARPGPESITIQGRPNGIAGGVTTDAHHDHRLAMALAIVALRAKAPISITGATHVAKSYPAFWSELARLGATVEGLG